MNGGVTGPSLKARALRLLAQREHSRAELERKLRPHESEPGTLAQALDGLEARGFISETRVADSVLHRRADKLGTARVRGELQAKGLSEAVAFGQKVFGGALVASAILFSVFLFALGKSPATFFSLVWTGGFGSSFLARHVGQKKAREIWFLCEQYTAQEALDMGMVNKVVPLAELEDETVRWCKTFLKRSPLAR